MTIVAKGMEALRTIRKYNEDIQNAKNSGPDAVPPVPPKKKTGEPLTTHFLLLLFVVVYVVSL